MAQHDVEAQLGTSFVNKPHRVLHRLMSVFDVSDIDLALELGVSRQTVYNRRTARRAMSLADIEMAASALGVPPMLLLGTEADALRWVVANQPERFDIDDEGVGEKTVWHSRSDRFLLAS